MVRTMVQFDKNMTLGQIMDIPELKAIVVKHLPDIESDPRFAMGRSLTLEKIMFMLPGPLKSIVDKIADEFMSLGSAN